MHLEGRAAGERRLGSGDATYSRPFWGRAELSRAAQQGGGGAVATSLTGAPRAPLQDGGDFLVPADRRRRQVPRPPVTVVLRVRGGGERRMRCPPIGRSRPAVDRGADERVPERDGRPQDHEPGSFGGRRRFGLDPQDRGGPQEKGGVGRRIGRRQKQEHLGVDGKRPGLAGEALLEPPAQRERLQCCRGTDQLTGMRVLGEFDERQRVAPRFGDDPVCHLTIAAEPCLGGEQRMRRFIGQTVDLQHGEPLERARRLRSASLREDQGDPVRLKSTPPESERLDRFAVDPMGVVDQTQKAFASSRRVRSQIDDSQSDEEVVAWLARRQSQRRVQGVALRFGKPPDLVQDRH